MQLAISLPCKPLVLQYLLNRYGTSHTIPDADWVKCLVNNLLTRQQATFDSQIEPSSYPCAYLIPITYKQYELYGDALSKTAIREINNRIKDLVDQQLYQFIEFYVHVCGWQLKQAIEVFRHTYNYPEEAYSTDAILKQYQRNIKPQVEYTIVKFTSANVLSYRQQIRGPYKQRQSRAA